MQANLTIIMVKNKYFELKKTRGAPMGRPNLKLLASNGVHICHAIQHGPSKS